MYIIFEKSRANGTVAAHFDLNWDVLKYKLTQLDTFPSEEWESRRYAWENLRRGDSPIIDDGAAFWQYFDLETLGFTEKDELELFNGQVILLNEIDPIFD